MFHFSWSKIYISLPFTFIALAYSTTQQKSLRLHTLACGFGKNEDPKSTLTRSKNCVTHNELYKNYREDACTIYHGQNIDMLAVADGVGGWIRKGIDSGTFSGGMMSFLKQINRKLEENDKLDDKIISDPILALEVAYDKVLKTPECQGSSTVVTANFNKKNGMLYTSNLGDSGFVIMNFNSKSCPNDRNSQNGTFGSEYFSRLMTRNTYVPVNKEAGAFSPEKLDGPKTSTCSNHDQYISTISEDQLHGFNFPYQLSFQPHAGSDKPSISDVSKFQMSIGDVIILASDGVLDNLYPADMEEIIMSERLRHSTNVDGFLEAASLRILKEARRFSWDDNYLSPFAKKARESDMRYRFELGGKVDDTTVIVAVVGHD